MKNTKNRKDLTDLCDYIFQHEFEDYCNSLQENLPEDEADKIEGYIKAGDIPALEAYAYKNGNNTIQHIYATACRVYRDYLK